MSTNPAILSIIGGLAGIVTILIALFEKTGLVVSIAEIVVKKESAEESMETCKAASTQTLLDKAKRISSKEFFGDCLVFWNEVRDYSEWQRSLNINAWAYAATVRLFYVGLVTGLCVSLIVFLKLQFQVELLNAHAQDRHILYCYSISLILLLLSRKFLHNFLDTSKKIDNRFRPTKYVRN